MFQQFYRKHFITTTALLIALTSCGHSNPDIHGGNSAPVRVKAMLANPSASASSETYSGTTEAGSSTTLSFSVAGILRHIAVSEGQRVSKGQLIASVDGASLQNAYDIAQATLREARDAYDRMKKLHEANALPDMQWVSVQEKLKQAESAAAIAKAEMNDANIYAPMSGMVARKLADIGQNVAPGIPVVEMMDVSSLKVKISIPESDLANLTIGENAIITAGEHTYSGKLEEKAVTANPFSRTYDVKFRITNPDEYLLPGMICSVSVDGEAQSGEGSDSADIVLPPQAVVLDWDNTCYVWVKSNGVAKRVKVDVGGLDSRGIVVTGGLTPSDSVIVEGQQKLSSGLKVVSVN